MQIVKNERIQFKNGQDILENTIKNSSLVLDTFLTQIEETISEYRNFELLQHVVTKEQDETYQFRSRITLTNKHFDAIYSIVEQNDVKLINDMIRRDDDVIERIDIKDHRVEGQSEKDQLEDQEPDDESQSKSRDRLEK